MKSDMSTGEKIIRYIAGYVVGVTIFLALIPYGIYLSSLLFERLWRLGIIDNIIGRALLALCVFLPGIVFVAWSNALLLFKGKGGPTEGFGVAVSPPTRNLVVTGPYRFTRNPMVFGAFCCYFSLAIFLNSFPVVIALIIMLMLVVLYLKRSEEKRLLRDFGDEYVRYRNSVSMIVPFPRPKSRMP